MADPDLAKAFSTIINELMPTLIILLIVIIIIRLLLYLLNKKGNHSSNSNKYTPYKINGAEEYEKQLDNKDSGRNNSAEIKYQPYIKKGGLLSHSELKLYKILKNLLGDKYELSSKVRIPDIIQVKSGDSAYFSFNRIRAKHVDFLICYKDTMKPKLAIELDGSSHNRPDRQERDKFVDEVFANAGIPITHIKVKHEYNEEEIIKQLQQADKIKYVIKQKED